MLKIATEQIQMTGMKQQRKIAVIISVGLVVLVLWYANSRPSNASKQVLASNGVERLYDVRLRTKKVSFQDSGEHSVRTFDNRLGFSPIWFSKRCFKISTKALRIDNIGLIIDKWRKANDRTCRSLFKVFSSIYLIQSRSSEVIISDSFSKKVLKWFKDNKELLKETKYQQLTSVSNKYTQESTVFNPLRAKRPGAGGGGGPEVKKAVDEMIQTSSQDCDFCNYKKMTAQDPFGRVESKYAVSVANTFKIEKFHGLILFRHHNPMEYTEEQFMDLMDVAQRWFGKAHETDKEYTNPHIYWDVLPKASASQVHPHLHVNLASNQYYSKWARLHAASLQYASDHSGANYFTDLVKIHSVLGLTVKLGNATVMAYITPQASHELVFISSCVCKDIFRLLFFSMRAYIDDMGLFAMSAGAVFPKLIATPQNGDLPMIVRLVYRGAVTSTRADISSIELFGTPNVNVDPYKVIQSIKNTMVKHGVKPDSGDSTRS